MGATGFEQLRAGAILLSFTALPVILNGQISRMLGIPTYLGKRREQPTPLQANTYYRPQEFGDED